MQQKDTKQALTLEDETLRESASLLREHGRRDAKHFAFLDRPIVLTVLGTIVLTLITQSWQTMEHRHTLDLQNQKILLDRKFELLQELASGYNKTSNIFNEYLQFSIEFKRALDEPNAAINKKELDKSQAHILSLLSEWRQSPPLTSILLRVSVLYESTDVRSRAKTLRQQWVAFQDLSNELDTAMPTKLNAKRDKLRQSLDDEVAALLDAMAVELAHAPYQNKQSFF